MMHTKREHPTHTAGAHRAHQVRRRAQSRSDRYEPYLDGLFTYCLSVMCEHDAATAALGEALALAERQRGRDRMPADPKLFRPWLYALARWACLRRLAELRQTERDRRGHGRTGAEPTGPTGAAATQRRRDLAALAWPEAAGTTPGQREALELAVRHGLPAREVAAVLSMAPDTAVDVLTAAACEVERTRAALAVVESGNCPAVARLAGDDRLFLGAALRRELVRHVDDCPECRRAAERAMAGVTWPGTAPVGRAPLAVLQCPRPAITAAVRAAQRARCQHTPRCDKNGFPLDVKDRAARRDRIRNRAVTTTVVATVVAAPVLARWAAYRGAPLTGEGRDAASVSAAERDGEQPSLDGHPYENAGRAEGAAKKHGKHDSDVSVEVVSADPSDDPSSPGATGLTVTAHSVGGGSLVTLTATGGEAVSWGASTSASWLVLSNTGGTLQPGQTASFTVRVVESREPAGAWSARIHIAPAGAVVTLSGRGAPADTPAGGPAVPGGPAPTHSSSPSTTPDDPASPSEEPTSPSPTTTPSTTPSSPTPTPSTSGTPS
jgi:DNA-directed RNA polymerase specialized sigma24 family protein